MFEPIAIVGQACVLPGALTPAELWDAVSQGKNLLSSPPEGYWRTDPQSVLLEGIGSLTDNERARTDRGGYVSGFDAVFDPSGFQIAADQLLTLDPLFHWLLHTAREALGSADKAAGAAEKTGVIIGNLSYPSHQLTQLAEFTWLQRQQHLLEGKAADYAGIGQPAAVNRYMSGYPAHLVASALGLGGAAFCLDAACASSLYAIKLACNRLQDRHADVMLAGGINRADDLFLHIGFSALQALSKKGQSLPFNLHADGLLPAEGAAFVALKRLSDAIGQGDEVLGVIRAVGLSNDGRSGSFLAPAMQGQIRAMQSAYDQSGLLPTDISLMECHATGTPVGDTEEIKSMHAIFKDHASLPIGSLKSNMGHLITASGLAGLMKVMASMKAGVRPPTLNADAPIEILKSTPFRLLNKAEPWQCDGVKRAGINNFGFGGNNAHLIVEEYHTTAEAYQFTSLANESIAIVGIGVVAGSTENTAAFVDHLFANEQAPEQQIDKFVLPLQGLRFPPNDLKKSLPQQTLMIKVAGDAVADAGGLNGYECRTGAFVGMQCDAEIARFGARWRMSEWSNQWSDVAQTEMSDEWCQQARDGAGPYLEAAGVVGAMPNIPANRLNSQFDWQGYSFTFSSEELSGIAALDSAVRALRAGELDAALVGAVDMCCEPVNTLAALQVLPESRHQPGDAAVALILKRLDDARKDGDHIYAVIPAANEAEETDLTKLNLDLNIERSYLTQLYGHAHCVSGLLHVTAAAMACASRAQPASVAASCSMPWLPTKSGRQTQIEVTSFSGQQSITQLAADEMSRTRFTDKKDSPTIHVFSDANRQTLIEALKVQQESLGGPAKLVIINKPGVHLHEQIALAIQLLEQNKQPGKSLKLADDIYFSEQPIAGELAFVYTGAAAAYAGMGRELLMAMPELAERLSIRFSTLAEQAGWVYQSEDDQTVRPSDQLKGCSMLCQIHSELTLHVLGLKPTATLGMSSGETNALYAMGIWRDLDEMFQDIDASEMYPKYMAGQFAAAKVAWNIPYDEVLYWRNWQILAPVEMVQEEVAKEEHVRITIINGDNDCVIGGKKEACLRVINNVGKMRAFPLGHDLVTHCNELEPFIDKWREIHHRETFGRSDVRFYTNATNSYIYPDTDNTTESLTVQALNQIDFRKTVENAWNDGVRIFIEHGPRNSLSNSIEDILGEREHLVMALDQAKHSSLLQACQCVAQLLAAGIEVDYQMFMTQLEKGKPLTANAENNKEKPMPTLTFDGHYPDVNFPAVQMATDNETNTTTDMAPAPWLPPVLDEVPISATVVANPVAAISQPQITLPSQPTAVISKTVNPEQVVPQQKTAASENQSAAVTSNDPISEFMAQTAAMHEQFVEQQSRLHQQFLALQEKAWVQFTSGQPVSSTVLPVNQPMASVTQSAPSTPVAAPMIKPVQNVAEKTKVMVQQKSAKVDVVKPEPVVSKPTVTVEVAVQSTPSAPIPQGLKISREGLEILASGKISSVLGPLFEQQDGYALQVRMPEPPLLLADRVTGIVGEPGTMGTGTIWTETDVPKDAWYLHQGAVPPGIMIESGQADLLLISWLGADFLNKGERVYRLLGCELTYHEGGMPKPGDTLCYDIHVDGHARHGDVRLFFFHYDCRVNDQLKLSVRSGQAGFFNTKELSESGGVLWSPEDDEPKTPAQLDPSPAVCSRTKFGPELVQALADGKAYACFGEGFEATACHTRTPGIPNGLMKMWHEVSELDAKGGPWKRGYLRAETEVTEDDWYFKGHFKNDPCMPGTLMADAATQTMAFYMISQGFTFQRDGWRFEPMPDEAYKFVCRGQVLPHAKHITYEMFVEEVIDGLNPVIYAALLCTCDGLKVFQCRRFGLRLVPDWPLTSMSELLAGHDEVRAVGNSGDVGGDYSALLACAWGAPTAAFGQMYKRFDGPCTVPRLPGPPYHFMSRVLTVEGHPGVPVAGHSLVSEYDVPPDAWYFNENGHPVMPFCVLLEVLLQPCGWFGSFMGFATKSDDDLCIRNLDGDSSKQLVELGPDFGTLRIHVSLTKLSQMGPMALVFFHVDSYRGEQLIHTLNTSFGFFSQAALVSQVGLPVSDEVRSLRDKDCDYHVDLATMPEKFCKGSARIANPMLRMIDELTGYWPDAGEAGLGRIRARQTVDPDAWYFKAHFFQDPVQPGSLGIEALLQLLQCFMLEKEMDSGFNDPRFEAIAMNEDSIWKYRGQVIPKNKYVYTELEITRIEKEENSILAVAKGSLWVDEIRIYEVVNLAMRITDGSHPCTIIDTNTTSVEGDQQPKTTPTQFNDDKEIVLHRDSSAWVLDHCPTYTVPALPMMVMAEYLGAAAKAAHPDMIVLGLEDVQVLRWVIINPMARLKTEVEAIDGDKVGVVLLLWRDAAQAKLSRFESVAKGVVRLGHDYESISLELSALEGAHVAENPYETGAMFHGPDFQVLKQFDMASNGSQAILDAAAGKVPAGILNPVLLDGATHAIPHDQLNQWFDTIADDQVAYPHRIASVTFHQATPLKGDVLCEVRSAGFEGGERHPVFHLLLSYDDKIWMEMMLVEILFPKGRLGCAAPADRRSFLRDHHYVENLSLSEWDGNWTKLTHQMVNASNWLPGTLETVYNFKGKQNELTQHIVIKEHIARQEKVHPDQVVVAKEVAYCKTLPLTAFPIKIFQSKEGVSVQDNGAATQYLDNILAYWRSRLEATGAWPVEDIFFALIRRFVRRVVLTNPDEFEVIKNKSVLFLGNHQVGIESLLFSVIAGGLTQVPVVTVAKAEHRNTWLGRLIALCQKYPGKKLPKNIMFFERQDQHSMLKLIAELKNSLVKEGLSLMVHSEGTRALHCRQPVKKLSSVFIDLAIAGNIPIVPVRFSGGLPPNTAPDAKRLEFPIGYGKQDYYIGKPIMPETLKNMTLPEKTQLVLSALNTLGPDLEYEEPNLPNPDFASRVIAWSKQLSVPPEYAAIFRTLKDDSRVGKQMQKLLDSVKKGRQPAAANDEDKWLLSFSRWLGMK